MKRFKYVILAMCAAASLYSYLVLLPKYLPVFSLQYSSTTKLVENLEPYSQLDTNEEILLKQESNGKASGGAPRAIILWTTWRSGSTFIGGLLARALPDTFYSAEPLYWWKDEIHHENNSITFSAQEFLHDIMHCRVQPKYQEQLFTLTWKPYYMEWNEYYAKNCAKVKDCGNTTLLTHLCQKARIHVAKVIRLSLRWAWPLLEDEDLGVKMIYLARDPRAVLSSRSYRAFCKKPSCIHPQTVCRLLEDDLQVATKMLRKYPRKFKYIQYEKIASNPLTGLTDLMAFVGLPVSDKQLELLKPLHLEPDSLYGINKESEKEVNEWRKLNSFTSVVEYQRACLTPIRMMGLRVFTSGDDFRNLSLALLSDRLEH